MTKKKSKSVAESIDAWTKGLDKIFEEKRTEDEKLSPSRPKMRYIKDYSRSIMDYAHNITLFSEMFHQGILEQEKAQQYIDVQKKHLKRDIEMLLSFIAEEDEDDSGTD
jgi:hypothetical protein